MHTQSSSPHSFSDGDCGRDPFLCNISNRLECHCRSQQDLTAVLAERRKHEPLDLRFNFFVRREQLGLARGDLCRAGTPNPASQFGAAEEQCTDNPAAMQ